MMKKVYTNISIDEKSAEILSQLAIAAGLPKATYLRVLIHSLAGNPHAREVWGRIQRLSQDDVDTRALWEFIRDKELQDGQ